MEKVNGIALYDEGVREGLPVVLIHGFPFNRQMWGPQLRALSAVYRVISYDVRGHGASDVGDGQYSLELFVDDLLGILESLNLKQAVLCGLSMGGYIALRMAERNPERVKALVLCDTKSEADGNEAKLKRAASVLAVKKNGSVAFAQEFVKAVLTEETLQSRPELVRSVAALIAGNTPLGIAGALLAMVSRTDTTPALPYLSFPALILVGEQDKLTPPSAAEAMRKALPHAELHVIPQAAHLSNLENPEVFNEKLLAFLKNLSLK